MGRRHQPSSPPNKTVTTYHLFPRKYTGLANKDAGDFLGDASFIFLTFNPFEEDNPEASMQENIIEMSTVTVKGWSTQYLKCNAPGAVYNSSHGSEMNCPKNSKTYCCEGNRTEVTSHTLPGYEKGGTQDQWFLHWKCLADTSGWLPAVRKRFGPVRCDVHTICTGSVHWIWTEELQQTPPSLGQGL